MKSSYILTGRYMWVAKGCYNCGKPFQLGDKVHTTQNARTKTKRYCYNCAVLLNLIE